MHFGTQIKPNPQSLLNQFHSTWVDSEGVQGIYPHHNWLKFPKKYWYGPLPLEKQLNPFASRGRVVRPLYM